jgi:hypothetical protein
MLVTSSLEPNWERIEKYYSIPFGVILRPKKKQAETRAIERGLL